MFVLILLSIINQISACPFNTSIPNNPCVATSCAVPGSLLCKVSVDSYCEEHPNERACILFQKPKACPFNGNATSNPCKVAVCDDPTSKKCQSHVDRYCISYPKDSGCISFTEQIVSPSPSPSQSSQSCPFNSTISNNPCVATSCDVPGSLLCKDTVDSYCEEHPNDNGCVLFQSKKQKKLPPSYCPFNGTSTSNPCNVMECTSATSNECVNYVDTYCLHNANDRGCILFNIKKVKPQKYCPFNNTNTNTNSTTTPCDNDACISNSTSQACRKVVNQYCNQTDNNNDIGCRLFTQRSKCLRLYTRDLSNPDQCNLCPDGTKWSTGTDGYGTCTQCPSGTRGNGLGAETCIKCEVGTKQDVLGKTYCDLCPRGTTGDTIGLINNTISICRSCPIGKASNVTGSTSPCIACIPGKIAKVNGSSLCSPCLGGTYQADPGKSFCDNCSPGKYHNGADAIGSSVCKRCPIGRASNVAGTSICPVCPGGEYQKFDGQPTCVKCSPGRALVPDNSTDGHDHENDCKYKSY